MVHHHHHHRHHHHHHHHHHRHHHHDHVHILLQTRNHIQNISKSYAYVIFIFNMYVILFVKLVKNQAYPNIPKELQV